MNEVPLLEPLKIAPLARVSPSSFAELRACPLRAVCAVAKQPPLLASMPANIVGDVTHKMLEGAERGEFRGASNADIERAWDEKIAQAEEKMRDSPLRRRFVPLSRSVNHYQVRRIQACNKAAKMAGVLVASPTPSAVAFEMMPRENELEEFDFDPDVEEAAPGAKLEEWIATPDKTVGGFIDYWCQTADGIVLRDYKTGPVWEKSETGEKQIKASYVLQLQLYAAMVWSQTGQWPARVELVPLDGDTVLVPFDPVECMALLDEARNTLRQVNMAIEAVLESQAASLEPLASPAPKVCGFCVYRPGCAAYWKAQSGFEGTNWPRDVHGTLLKKHALGNGRIQLEIAPASEPQSKVRVSNLSPDAQVHPELEDLEEGDTVALYNLKPSGSSFQSTDLTVIFKQP